MIKKARLIEEIKKLKRKLFIWENIGISINSSLKEKEIAAEKFLNEHPDYNLYEVSDTIKINKGTLYHHLYTRAKKPWYVQRVEDLTQEVINVFEESNRVYGANKIVLALKKKGIIADKKTVLKIMRTNNLVKENVIKRKTPKVDKEKRNYYRNLLKQQFNADAPNKVWTSDLLEFKIRGVSFYLCAIMDLFSRMIVAWRISSNRNGSLVISTFKDAFENRNEPLDIIFHTDQGSEFKTNEFMEMLEVLGVKQSFSYKGVPNDNAPIEGFFSRLRSEELNKHIEHYENSRIAKEYLERYFNFYNFGRVHTYNGGLSPSEKEDEWYKNNGHF